jgi:membrane glycosyltransferase
VLSYVSAPLWLAFMTLGTALWLSGSQMVSSDANVLPVELVGLWAFTASVLFLPRVLGILAVLIKGEQRMFGGTWGLLKSSLLESSLALLQSPVRMLAHSLFVLVAITGIKLEWKSPPREAVALSWKAAASSLAPMTAVIALLAAGIAAIDASALIWLIPVGLPLLLAIPTSVVTSHADLGSTMRSRGFLLIPEERWSPAVLRRARLHANRMARPRVTANIAIAA